MGAFLGQNAAVIIVFRRKDTEASTTCACAAHLSAGEDVPSQLDLGKVALPDGFQQSVVADVGLLRLLGASGPDAGPGRAGADLLAAISVRRVLQRERDVIFRQVVSVHGHIYAMETCLLLEHVYPVHCDKTMASQKAASLMKVTVTHATDISACM